MGEIGYCSKIVIQKITRNLVFVSGIWRIFQIKQWLLRRLKPCPKKETNYNWEVILCLLIFSATCNGLFAQLVYNVEAELIGSELNVCCSIVKNKDSAIDCLIFDKRVTIDRVLEDGVQVASDYKPESDTIKFGKNAKKEVAFLYKIQIDTKTPSTIYLNRVSKWVPFKYDVVSPLNLIVKVPLDKIALSSNLKDSTRLDNCMVYEYVNTQNTHFPLILIERDNYVSEVVKNGSDSFQFYYPKESGSFIPKLKDEVVNTYIWMEKFMKGNFNKSLSIVCIEDLGYVQSLNQLMVVGTDFLGYINYPEMAFWPSHEVIHQWIGSGYFVNLKQRNQGRWFLEESLTEYLRYVYLESCYGKDTLKSLLSNCLLEYNGKIKNTSVDKPCWEAGPDRLTYGVAPLFYHYLRVKMGESKWRKFISEFYLKNYGKFIDNEIFLHNLKRYLDEDEYMQFVDWLKNRGVPQNVSVMIN
jgi:hypothetical protein